MVKYTPKEALIAQKHLIPNAIRKNRPTVIVEGDFDARTICKFCKTESIDIGAYEWESDDKKGDLINLVQQWPNQSVVIGIVDADYDGILEDMYDYANLLPYGENIFDTSPFTDMNLLLISDLRLEKYLLGENLTENGTSNVISIVEWFGVLRFLKKRYEYKNKCRVHIPLSELRKNIVQSRIEPPQTIEEFSKILEEISPHNTKRFFDDIRKFNRLEKVLSRFANEGIEFRRYINGHDLSSMMKLFGAKGRQRQIEERLIGRAKFEELKEIKLFTQLKEWGDQHSIEIF